MAFDGQGLEDASRNSYVTNLPGVIFYMIHMIAILTSIPLISDAPLGRLQSYRHGVYTLICGLHLLLFPLTLLFTYIPLFTPGRQTAASFYIAHGILISLLLAVTRDIYDITAGAFVLMMDLMMATHMIAGYGSILAFLLPFKIMDKESDTLPPPTA